MPERKGPTDTLAFTLEAHGYGAILQIAGAPSNDIEALMRNMQGLTKRPLASYSAEWKPLPQKMIGIAPAKKGPTAPEGMFRIPGGAFRFRVTGIEIEGFNDIGVDVQYPWEDS